MSNLTCRNAEELIVRDLDEGLDISNHVRLEDHLAGCPACRQRREQIRRLLSAVRADVPEDPGEDFWRTYDVSLEARLREKDLHRGTVFGRRVAWALAAAGVILLATALGVVNFKDPVRVDPVVSAAVMEELTELYGPRWEGDRLSMYQSTPIESVARVAAGTENYDEMETTWFEVEDERNHLFM